MLARDIMRTPAVSVSPRTGVAELAALMLREQLGVVPVVDGGVLVGLVDEAALMHRHELGTARDPAARPWWVRLFAGERCPATYVESHAAKVGDLRWRRVVSVDDDAPVREVVELLDTHRLRRLPVLRARRLVGTIGRPDLVRALADAARGPDAARPLDDELIHRALRSELEAQPWWHPTQSRIAVRDGVVHYHGLVDSADAADAARVAAENLPGVGAVVDHRLDASGTRWGWW